MNDFHDTAEIPDFSRKIYLVKKDDFFVKRSRKLIAEYPTWQEAVNSKEFNNK